MNDSERQRLIEQLKSLNIGNAPYSSMKAVAYAAAELDRLASIVAPLERLLANAAYLTFYKWADGSISIELLSIGESKTKESSGPDLAAALAESRDA